MGPDATIGDRCPPFLRPFARAATLDSANVEVDFPSKEVCSRVFLSKRIKKEVSGFQDPQGDQGVLKSGKRGCSFWIPCHSAGGNNPEMALFVRIGAQTSRMSIFFKILRRPNGMKPKMRSPIFRILAPLGPWGAGLGGGLKSGKPGCSFWNPCHSAGGNNPEMALFVIIGAQTSRMSSFFKVLRRPNGMKPKMRSPIFRILAPLGPWWGGGGAWGAEIRKTGVLILDSMPFGRRQQSRNGAIR